MPEQDQEKDIAESYFMFPELLSFYKRLTITAGFISICVLLAHYWLETIVIYAMYHVLVNSESAIHNSCKELKHSEQVSLSSRFINKIYGFGDVICSYVCGTILYFSIGKPYDLFGALINSVLMSFCVLFLIGAMKSIAIGFQFFRKCDIENGSIGLLTNMSIIIRFILVTPVWVCYLSGVPQNSIPKNLNFYTTIYIITKIIDLIILCYTLSQQCVQFFRSVLISYKGDGECQHCKCKGKNLYMAQCGHVMCMDCIDRSRRVAAKCALCEYNIPRKWTSLYKYGDLEEYLIYFVV